MLRKLFLSSWYFLVSLLVLLAVVISIIRVYPSIYQNYLPAIQDNVSSLLDKPVQADSIRIDWHGITPQIKTKNFSVFADENKYEQLLNVDDAIISIDVYRSLLGRKIVFSELTFIGGNLEALRTADERIILNGIDISERLAERKKLNKRNELNINLLNSSISIVDEVKKLDYFFDQVDVVLKFSGENFKVSSKFVLPKTLGNSLVLSADVRDFHKGLKNIKGTLYSQGENINLELFNDFFPGLQVGIRKGISDFQIWGNFNSLRKREFVGSLALRDLIYKSVDSPIQNIKTNDEIISVDTKFRLQGDIDNWQLALSETNVNTAGQSWSGEAYEVSCAGCGKNDYTISADLGYINTDNIFSTLQHFPFLSDRLSGLFNVFELHASLESSQISLKFNDHQLIKYAYESSILKADVSIPEQQAIIKSITGELKGNHIQGNIALASDAMTVQLDKIFQQTLGNQKVSGVVKWQYSDDQILVAMQDISVGSNEMVASLQGFVKFIDDKQYADLQVGIPYVKAETIKQYFPYKKMKPKLSKWLSEGIVGGTLKNGKLLLHGNPKNFPFKNKPGGFEVIANVEDGILNYRNNWPVASNIITAFKIKNNYLEVNASQGSILDSSIHQVSAKIDDFKLAKIEINGSADGPANDILKYLQQSSLLPKNSKVVKHISGNGKVKLDLNIVLSLTKKIEKQRLVSGIVDFKNAGLTVNALSLPFTNLNGKLAFDNNGAVGHGITAKLYNVPVTAKAVKINNGRTLLSVAGDLDLDNYFSTNYTKLNKYIKGIAPISAEINLPKFGKNSSDKSIKINVDSDLYGVTSLLPEPFKKAFDESRKINIQTHHQPESDGKILANLDNQAFLKAHLGQDNGKPFRMELRMGDEKFRLPENGVKLSGKMNSLNLSEWEKIMQSEEEKAFELEEIDLSINHVKMGQLELDNVKFRAAKNSQFWSGDISSSVAKGEFEYPIDVSSGSIATANFDYLRFTPKTKSTSSTKAIQHDPRSLPALVVHSKQFKYKDAVFNEVSLKTKPSENGLVIDSLRGDGQDLLISANGTWSVDEENIQNTNLTINLESKNMHNSLNGLGFDSAVTGGEGSVAANFSWPKAPYQFSLASVNGHAKLRFKDGAISSVEPGAGRLLGLFNLGEISRRLSLDFTDFFSKGYAFEKIRGDLHFKDANLTTENLKIKGPSADLRIQGRTGIEAQDYDQIVTVTPHVSGGLPWIGLAVGGPLGAVGVMVGEKIAKSIGVDVNKVTEVQYSMKGSWQEPVIEPLSQKIAGKKSLPQSQGQPSPGTVLKTPVP